MRSVFALALAVSSVMTVTTSCAGAGTARLGEGEWYGKILSVDSSRRELTFVPLCKPNQKGVWVAVPPRLRIPSHARVAARAVLVVFAHVKNPAVLELSQRVSLARIGEVVLHGRRPTYFPGWWVTVKAGETTVVKENAGITVRGTPWAATYGCIYSPATAAIVGTDTT